MHAELAAVPNSLYHIARANRVIASVLCSSETPMWFPVELHSPSAQRGGLPAALKATLEQHAHYHIVDEQKIANHQCDSSPTGAALTFARLNDCSATYIGTGHMRPVAPFCAFRLAPELGIAYLQHLIDYEPLTEKQSSKRWFGNALYAFVHVLLRDHESLSVVVMPLPIAGEPPAGFLQVASGDRYHIKRTEQSVEPELPNSRY